MADQDDDSDKSHEPSQRKLEKAREKGEIPRSQDLMTAMIYLGVLTVALVGGADILRGVGDALLPLIEQPDRLEQAFAEPGATRAVGALIVEAMTPTLPLFVLPPLLLLATLLGTQSIVFTPSKLAPKISRIDPIQNAKSKYGLKGLFEFFKNFLKMMVYSACLAIFLTSQKDIIVGAVRATPAEGMALVLDEVVQFMAVVLGISAVIAMLDYGFQVFEHRRKNRMSHKEMRDEHKDAEGDPYMKAQRRMRGEAIALNQMMGEVPKSDVVIVNPTHYAVALKWSRAPGSAPVCVAKGTDLVAAEIRRVAQENGVPIHSDPPTARALHATTELGAQIAVEHYAPVAAAIRFAEAMRRRARQRGWG